MMFWEGLGLAWMDMDGLWMGNLWELVADPQRRAGRLRLRCVSGLPGDAPMAFDQIGLRKPLERLNIGTSLMLVAACLIGPALRTDVMCMFPNQTSSCRPAVALYYGEMTFTWSRFISCSISKTGRHLNRVMMCNTPKKKN